MIDVEIEIDMGGVIEKLEAMQARSKNFYIPLMEAKKSLGAYNAANFASQGGLVGGWKPHDFDTHAGWPVLIRSGKLEASLVSLDGPPNRVGRTRATFGTSVKYAKFHESGTFKMPRREIVFEPKGWARGVAESCVNHILGLDTHIG